MSSPDHSALLEQLQAQVNVVLEQTGRVFAAVNSNPKIPPVAQVTKLQNTLPVASKRFHQALDQLENELQMAALVMRRDLAVCRERSSASCEAIVKSSSEVSLEQKTSASAQTPENQALEKTEGASEEDVQMLDEFQDSAPAPANIGEKPAATAAKVDPTSNVELDPNGRSSPKDAIPDVTGTSVTGSGKEGADAHNGDLSVKTAFEDSKTDHVPGEEKAPDTATGDMDSLFNDPTSAEDATAVNAFDFDQNNSNELDFGSFDAGFDSAGADNDNISSLLPGLEDYANTQTNAAADVMDFSSFFDTGDNGQNTGIDQQGSGEQRDTTFDDLMDLANFEGMDGDDNNNNGNNHNADLDFEALFN